MHEAGTKWIDKEGTKQEYECKITTGGATTRVIGKSLTTLSDICMIIIIGHYLQAAVICKPMAHGRRWAPTESDNTARTGGRAERVTMASMELMKAQRSQLVLCHH